MRSWMIVVANLVIMVPAVGGPASESARPPAVLRPSPWTKPKARVDRLLASLRTGMSEQAVERAIDAYNLMALPMVATFLDPDRHVTFVGDDRGPITFQYDKDGRLTSWRRWK